MKVFVSLLRILGLLTLVGAAAPASQGDIPSAAIAVFLGLMLIVLGGEIGKSVE